MRAWCSVNKERPKSKSQIERPARILLVHEPSVRPVRVVGWVCCDGIRVLGNRVAVVTVLEEPVPCAVNGGIADRRQRAEDSREIDKRRVGPGAYPNKSYTTHTLLAEAAWPKQNTEKVLAEKTKRGGIE